MKPKFITSICLLSLMSMLVPVQASANDHDKTFGVKTGYISRNKSAVAGLFFEYTCTEHFKLAPEVNIAFRNDQRDALLLDVNAQFPLKKTGLATFYPYAGLNYSSWSLHRSFDDQLNSKDVTSRSSGFGLNLGGGMGLNLSTTLMVKIEAGYTMVASNSAFRATVGIGYNF